MSNQGIYLQGECRRSFKTEKGHILTINCGDSIQKVFTKNNGVNPGDDYHALVDLPRDKNSDLLSELDRLPVK